MHAPIIQAKKAAILVDPEEPDAVILDIPVKLFGITLFHMAIGGSKLKETVRGLNHAFTVHDRVSNGESIEDIANEAKDWNKTETQ